MNSVENRQTLNHSLIDTLRGVMGEDFPFLVRTFLDDSQTKLSQLHSLEQPFDRELIRRLAHSFRGSCCNMGAEQLAELCGHLEDDAESLAEEDFFHLMAIIERQFNQVKGQLNVIQ